MRSYSRTPTEEQLVLLDREREIAPADVEILARQIVTHLGSPDPELQGVAHPRGHASQVRYSTVTECGYVGSMAAVLDLGIDLDIWPWVWIGVAVVFALVELTALAGSFVLLPFAVSAFASALAGFYGASVEVQWAIFVFGGAALWMLFWRYAKKFINDNAMPEGVGADRLVGITAVVTHDIDPDDSDRRGRVKVVGEDWGALTDGNQTLRSGSKVRIVAMNGTRVMVEAVTLARPTEPPVAPPTKNSPPSSITNPPEEK